MAMEIVTTICPEPNVFKPDTPPVPPRWVTDAKNNSDLFVFEPTAPQPKAAAVNNPEPVRRLVGKQSFPSSSSRVAPPSVASHSDLPCTGIG